MSLRIGRTLARFVLNSLNSSSADSVLPSRVMYTRPSFSECTVRGEAVGLMDEFVLFKALGSSDGRNVGNCVMFCPGTLRSEGDGVGD